MSVEQTHHSPLRRRYADPPVVEAIARVHYATASRWRISTPGLLFDALREDYPTEPQPQNLMQAAVQVPSGSAVASQLEVTQGPSQIFFKNIDESRQLLVGPQDISVHSLPPYEGWESLEERLINAVTGIQAVLPEMAQYSSVGLRYINRLELPAAPDGTQFNEWLTVSYSLPPSFPKQLTNFLDRSEYQYADEPVRLAFTWGSVESSEPDTTAIVLDLDLMAAENSVASLEEAIAMLRKLKHKETEAFESLLQDSARRIFNEIH